MPRSLWLLIIGMMVNVTGSSFLWPLNTIYFMITLERHYPWPASSSCSTQGPSVAGNLIGGFLFDKIGGYRSILLGILITLTALGGMNLWHGWPHYVVFLTIVGFGSGIVFHPCTPWQGLCGRQGEGRRSMPSTWPRTSGSPSGRHSVALLHRFSFNYIFLANFVMYIVFFLIALFGYKKISAQVAGHTSVIQESRPIRDRSKLTALLLICGAYLLCWVGYVQWQSTIASYTQENQHFP